MRSQHSIISATVVAVTIICTGCTGTFPTQTGFDASQYVGTYAGTWTNTATGASGDAQIDITIEETTKTATLSIDFGGNYLGLGDPPAADLTGTYDDTGAYVSGQSTLFGRYDVMIGADGTIVGLMRDVGGGTIPALVYTGTLTPERLDADYEVVFADGSEANSTLRLTRVP